MCGIAGSLHFKGPRDFKLWPLLNLMRQRGPDECSVIERASWSIGANRLAISAPQERNTQPLWSPDKRFCFVFNGEIYNHKEMRERLARQGCQFKTLCDTETLFCAYLKYGEEAFLKLEGMFACAIFDTLKNQWILARDPFGVKPLYFQNTSKGFVFASEIKPLLLFRPSGINKKALPFYLQRRFVLGRETLFSNIFRVLPGEIMTVSIHGKMETKKYYSPEKISPSLKSKKERLKELSNKLAQSAQYSAKSEVGLGVLLSGGLDSSLINSMAGSFQTGGRPSFEAWFFDKGYDSRERARVKSAAKRANQKLNVVHAEPNDFLLLPKAIRALEEPLGDSVIIPTWKLMRHISQKEKAALSGEGADEILGGYVHHWIFFLFKKIEFLKFFPAFFIAALPSGFLNILFPYPGKIEKARLLKSLMILKQKGLKRFIEANHLFSSEEINDLSPGLLEDLGFSESRYPDISSLKELLLFDIQNWLANYNLLRLDKLSMAHSLEARVPYLNLDFASFCLSLPESDMISLFWRKRILRKLALRSGFLNFRESYRKKHPFTFRDFDFYGEPYREFVRDHLDQSFREAWNISPQALEKLLCGISFKGKKLKRANQEMDLLSQKQISSLLNLSVWTKEFFP